MRGFLSEKLKMIFEDLQKRGSLKDPNFEKDTRTFAQLETNFMNLKFSKEVENGGEVKSLSKELKDLNDKNNELVRNMKLNDKNFGNYIDDNFSLIIAGQKEEEANIIMRNFDIWIKNEIEILKK